jgi:hypothetical protein
MRRSSASGGVGRSGRNGQAFKGTWLHRVRSTCGIDVPRTLQQVGPVPALVPLTSGPPD